MYDEGLGTLAAVWHSLGVQAGHRYEQLAQGHAIAGLRQDARTLAETIGRTEDATRAELTDAW